MVSETKLPVYETYLRHNVESHFVYKYFSKFAKYQFSFWFQWLHLRDTQYHIYKGLKLEQMIFLTKTDNVFFLNT